jgi:uncharacterized protein DUF6541
VTYIRVGLGVLLVGVAPGVLVVLATRVRLSVIEALAVIPACSLGVVFLLAEATTLVHIPFAPAAFLIMLFSLGILAVVAWRAPIRRELILEEPPVDYDGGCPAPVDIEKRPRRFTPQSLLAIGLLVLAVIAGGSSCARGVHGGSTIPGNFDASQHGFMTARIASTDSIAPDDVLVSDLRTGTRAANYYPLATHASAALVHRIAGVEISLALTVITVFFAAFVLPLGLYALVRYLWPRQPLAAGFAALLGVCLVSFPYSPTIWGGIPLIVGMALVPISVVFLTRTLLTASCLRAAALTALVLAAGFAVHNSQLPLVVLLSGLLVAERAVRARSWGTVTDAVRRLAIVGVGLLVMFAPTLAALAQGGSDRAEFTDRVPTSLEAVLGPILTLQFPSGVRQGWLALLALGGILLLMWQRRLWSWVLGCVIVVALTLVAATTQQGIAALTIPWYRQSERVAYNLVFFVPVFGGIALATLIGWVRARLPGGRLTLAGCAVGGLTFVAIAIGLPAGRAAKDQVRASTTSPIQPIGQDSLAAFRYLRSHAGRGLVLNDVNNDGSLWMYPFNGVRPLFALAPSAEDQRGGEYRRRLYIHDHIQQAGSNHRLDQLLDEYGVDYVYWGGIPFLAANHEMDLASLRGSPGLEEVFTSEYASVFRVK